MASDTKHIRAIERRMYHLDSILLDYHGRDPQPTWRELCALRWALPILCEHTGVKQVYVAETRFEGIDLDKQSPDHSGLNAGESQGTP